MKAKYGEPDLVDQGVQFTSYLYFGHGYLFSTRGNDNVIIISVRRLINRIPLCVIMVVLPFDRTLFLQMGGLNLKLPDNFDIAHYEATYSDDDTPIERIVTEVKERGYLKNLI